jgi:hypothetical protein
MVMAASKPKPKTTFDHKLPLTRKWVEDYRRWIREGCPTPEQEAARLGVLAGPDSPPDLQALIERAGRRRAAELGEEYVEDPLKRPPHQGGYPHITADEWAEFDRQMAEWQARRRASVQKL